MIKYELVNGKGTDYKEEKKSACNCFLCFEQRQ